MPLLAGPTNLRCGWIYGAIVIVSVLFAFLYYEAGRSRPVQPVQKPIQQQR